MPFNTDALSPTQKEHLGMLYNAKTDSDQYVFTFANCYKSSSLRSLQSYGLVETKSKYAWRLTSKGMAVALALRPETVESLMAKYQEYCRDLYQTSDPLMWGRWTAVVGEYAEALIRQGVSVAVIEAARAECMPYSPRNEVVAHIRRRMTGHYPQSTMLSDLKDLLAALEKESAQS